MEALARLPHVESTIEVRDRLAQRQVSPGPRVRAREVAREKPVGGPLAETAHRDQARLHLLVRQLRERVEVEVGARKPDDVLRLAAREAEREKLVLGRGRDSLPRREGPCLPHLLAEPLDQAIADRERAEEGHLLRRDRSDQHLERIGRERRPEAGEARRYTGEYLVSDGPSAKAVEVEREPDECPHDGLGLDVERLRADAARGGPRPQLAPPDNAMQAALMPHVRAIDAERAKALRREREVERPGHGNVRHSRTVVAGGCVALM